MVKIFVAIAAHNRRTITAACLPTVRAGLAENDVLKVYNDGSTEFDGDELMDWGAHEVHNQSPALGIEAQRQCHFREFWARRLEGFTHLYLTDADCLHDPAFRQVMLDVQARHGAPVCLYNTVVHDRLPGNNLAVEGDVIWRRFAPGVSYLLTLEQAGRIARRARRIEHWDWQVPTWLGNRMAITRTSWVDHLGLGGMHHPGDEGLDGGDRATAPTPWLVDKRAEVVEQLETL